MLLSEDVVEVVCHVHFGMVYHCAFFVLALHVLGEGGVVCVVTTVSVLNAHGVDFQHNICEVRVVGDFRGVDGVAMVVDVPGFLYGLESDWVFARPFFDSAYRIGCVIDSATITSFKDEPVTLSPEIRQVLVVDGPCPIL